LAERADVKVCFLALQAPDLSPGQRYRVEAYLPSLARAGIDVSYSWLLSRSDLNTFYGDASAVRKGLVAMKAAVRRMASLARSRNVDVFLVQREAFFLFGEWSERIASFSAPVVFDFDDALWVHAVSNANKRFARLKNVDKFERIVSLSSAVIAGNAYLAQWAGRYSSNVHIVPTVVDTDLFVPPVRQYREQVTIGWSGSPTTFVHLQSVLPALERIKAKYGSRVRFRVMGDPNFQYHPLGLKGERWTPQAELDLLREMQIGLMPVFDDELTLGKCGLKGLLSMAMGAATVMSPYGVATEIVQNGSNGLLSKTEDEWVDQLSTLIENPALRRRLGEAGRDTVVQRYSVQRWHPTLAKILTAASRR
jgi:glycosyltransferase involved in cell wall biosynthesis